MTKTSLQQAMLNNFTKILQAAEQHLADGSKIDGFSPGYSICGNIDNMYHGEVYRQMEYTKDNLVRRVPSYSGKYHYPVKGSAEYDYDPERTFDNVEDYWRGEYGEHRLAQLREMIDFINSPEWDDKFTTKRFSPAENLGFEIGQFYTTKDGEVYEFTEDDGSASPYFKDSDGDRTCVHLDEFEPPRQGGAAVEKRSVKAYMTAAAKELAAIAKLEAKQRELEKALCEHQKALRQIDVGLRKYHGVARI